MTGAAVALLERYMTYRVEEAFFRTAMGVMTAVAGIRTWLYVFVGFKEIRTCNHMAVCAK